MKKPTTCNMCHKAKPTKRIRTTYGWLWLCQKDYDTLKAPEKIAEFVPVIALVAVTALVLALIIPQKTKAKP